MSGKSPGKGGQERTPTPKAAASPGATGPDLPSHQTPRGSRLVPSTQQGSPTVTSTSRASQHGGVKRGPPIGPASLAKRGPASPSKGVPQNQKSPSGKPVTSSKVISKGLVKCNIGEKGTPSRGNETLEPSIMPMGLPGKSSEEQMAKCAPTQSGSVLSETKCRGCDFDKKSLRGHLVRTKKGCSKLYTSQDLNLLEEQAKSLQRKQTAQWRKDNDKSVNESQRRRYKEAEGLKCNICDKTCANQSNLDRHVKEIHNNESLLCPKCSRAFFRKDKLRDHLVAKHGIKHSNSDILTLDCTLCDKKFTNFSNRSRHVYEVHFGPTPIPCPYCKLGFSRQANLDSHIKDVHNGDKPFSCPECKVCFSRKGNLDNHILEVHKELVKWECNLCPFQTARLENMRRHLWDVHDKIKGYACNLCPEEFVRVEDVKRHIAYVHDNAEKLSCHICSKEFAEKKTLNRHIKDVHLEEKRWGCDECPADFSRWNDLKRHLDNKSAHWDLWECQYCDDDDLWFKSENQARKHFLFAPRSRARDKRSDCAVSCVNNEKRKKEEREQERKKLNQEAKEKEEKWKRYWEDLSVEDKEKEKGEYREDVIHKWKREIDAWEKSDKYKEARLNRLVENLDKSLTEQRMIELVRKKYEFRDFRRKLSSQLREYYRDKQGESSEENEGESGEENQDKLTELFCKKFRKCHKPEVTQATSEPIIMSSDWELSLCSNCNRRFANMDQMQAHCERGGPYYEECMLLMKQKHSAEQPAAQPGEEVTRPV